MSDIKATDGREGSFAVRLAPLAPFIRLRFHLIGQGILLFSSCSCI